MPGRHQNDEIATLSAAFESLISIGSYFSISSNANLASFGTSFRSSLTRGFFGGFFWGGSSGTSSSATITRHAAGLTTRLTFENICNLTYHGGFRYDGASYYCQGCPGWLTNLPTCECLDDPAVFCPGSTTASSRSITASLEVAPHYTGAGERRGSWAAPPRRRR